MEDEVIEEVLETATKFFDSPKKAAFVSGAVCLVVGAGIGYLAGRWKNRGEVVATVQVVDNFEVVENFRRNQYETLTPRKHTGEKYEEVIEVPRVLDGTEEGVEVLLDIPPKVVEWDAGKELSSRTRNAPYVLHQNEFLEHETDSTQYTYTYYAGDDVLCTEDDEPIQLYTRRVGQLRFGYGSEDPNVFYVRNEKRNEEYEIIRNEGHYSVEVLGLEMEAQIEAQELKHSKGVPKFRKE